MLLHFEISIYGCSVDAGDSIDNIVRCGNVIATEQLKAMFRMVKATLTFL